MVESNTLLGVRRVPRGCHGFLVDGHEIAGQWQCRGMARGFPSSTRDHFVGGALGEAQTYRRSIRISFIFEATRVRLHTVNYCEHE